MGMCLAYMTVAQGASNEELASQQMAVRELMQLDTRLALERTRDRLQDSDLSQAGAAAASALRHNGGPRLVAIYGVGKRLIAEVVIGAQTHVFVHGQATPVGMKAGASAYRLAGVSGTCVQLESKDDAHTLCLPPQTWARP